MTTASFIKLVAQQLRVRSPRAQVHRLLETYYKNCGFVKGGGTRGNPWEAVWYGEDESGDFGIYAYRLFIEYGKLWLLRSPEQPGDPTRVSEICALTDLTSFDDILLRNRKSPIPPIPE